MTTWYTLNYGKLSWRECWRFGENVGTFLAVVICKLAGKRTEGASVRRDGHEPKPEEELPPALRALFDAGETALQGSSPSFRRVADHLLPSLTTRTSGTRTMVSTDGRIIANIMGIARPGTSALTPFTSLLSRRTDGTPISTSNAPRRFDPTPGIEGVSLPGTSAAALLDAHRERLNHRDNRTSLRLFTRDEDVFATLLAEEHMACDEKVRRGLYVPMSEDDVRALKLSRGA